MPQDKLKTPPLIEVVFEIRWDPQRARKNPFFSIFWGGLHSKLNEKFPEIVSLLPDIPLPDEFTQNTYHYRFFSENKKFPMVQVGPGALTLHEKDPSYCWDSFKENIDFVAKQLFASHPKTVNFLPHHLVLRYADFFECDFAKADFFSYLKENLKIDFSMSGELFRDGQVTSSPSPYNLHVQTFFPCLLPDVSERGEVGLIFRGGERNKTQGIFMDTIVQCPQALPSRTSRYWSSHEEIIRWAEDAHNITHRWFFTLIEGELRKKFEQ